MKSWTSISNMKSYTCNIKLQVYMDALGLLLRLDTRDELDEFLDRLKILANCLTDQVNWFICLFPLHSYALLLNNDLCNFGFQAMWYQEWLFDITTIWALSKVGNTSQAHVLLEGLKSRSVPLSLLWHFFDDSWLIIRLTHIILTEHLIWARRNNSWCRKQFWSVLADPDIIMGDFWVLYFFSIS